MKIILKSGEEWGYYINSNTFIINKIAKDIPENCFVILKNREFIQEINRTVFKNTYGLVKRDKLETMNKRNFSDLLSVACSKYILKHNKLPPSIKIEDEPKDLKPISLVFFVGNYDVFHLKIEAELLNGKNPKNVIEPIIKSFGKSIFMTKRKDKWKVEYARSSQSTCRKCEKKIEEDALRLGEPSYYQNNLSFKWYHENCIDWSKYSLDNIVGLETLKENDRIRIQRKIKK